jgi:hypothetical protein
MISLLTPDMVHRPWWCLHWSIFDYANEETHLSVLTAIVTAQSPPTWSALLVLDSAVTPFIE